MGQGPAGVRRRAGGGGDGRSGPRAPLVAVVEAVLFAAAEPVRVARLAAACGVGEAEIRSALASLAETLADPRRGVELRQVAGGYRLFTKAEHAAVVEGFLAGERSRLSPAALETLAVVAYRQPVTRAEIEDVRGVQCDHALRTLLDRGLIRVVGRRDAPGRPLLYGTTDTFLEYLGLRDLGELPPVPGLSAEV